MTATPGLIPSCFRSDISPTGDLSGEAGDAAVKITEDMVQVLGGWPLEGR